MKFIFFFIFIGLFTARICRAQQTKKVLIIGIDGCRPDALQAANTPNMDALLTNAVYSFFARNNDITISGPGWSAMLTGVWSAKHGVVDNSFNGSNFSQYPHFFNRVESTFPWLNTVSISQWAPINNNIVLNNADYKVNAANETSVTMEAVNQLTNHNPDVMFLHYDDVDHEGHTTGFSKTNPAYLTQIQEVDTEIGFVLNALHNRPNYSNENWLILLSTDHGGINTSHGGTSEEERTVFTIAHNKSFVSKQIFPDTVIVPSVNCIPQVNYLTLNSGPDMVNIPLIPAYEFGTSGDFTVECRVRTNTPADVAIVSNKNWDSGSNKGFVLSFKYPSGPEWKVNIGDGTNRKDINMGGSIADGLWHHLAATFDRDGNLSMYEDGMLKGSTSMSSIGNIDNGAPLRIGADINGNYDFSGSVQEVRLWKKIINQTTLNNWKCTPLINSHPDYGQLVGYWRLNEGVGNQAGDLSTYNNDGTITSASWTNMDTLLMYDNTPRITDIALTALHWLCIDPLPAWALDGHTLLQPKPKVTSLTDLTAGSLRAAVLSSCPLDTIIFDVTTDGQMQLINSGEIIIPHQLTLEGNGTDKTFLSAAYLNRILNVPAGISLTVKNMLLTKGYHISSGGAFINWGNMYLDNVLLKDNLENVKQKAFSGTGNIQIRNVLDVKE